VTFVSIVSFLFFFFFFGPPPGQSQSFFQGTLRYNLDPFGRYDDDALWCALEKAHLKEKIVAAAGSLDQVLLKFFVTTFPVQLHHNFLAVYQTDVLCFGFCQEERFIVILDEKNSDEDLFFNNGPFFI
jgi:hypothetical protein